MEQAITVSTSESMEEIEQNVPICIFASTEQSIPVPSLSRFNFASASVLPTYKNMQGKTIAILSREAYGRDKGTYDDCGGKRDPGEKNPETTAARECWEELILAKTGPIDLQSLCKYISVDSDNTEYVIARTSKKSVMYISDFSPYWDNIRKTFYSARFHAKQHQYKEKDHLAVVPWDELQKVIAQSKPGQMVTMYAYGINKNGEYDTETMLITLRPFLVAKLKPFFQNQPFQQGDNQKTRFYQ